MRPVKPLEGLDCFELCIAAVLGVSAEFLPDDIVADEARVERWRDVLGPMGWDMLLLAIPPLVREAVPRGYWVAVVESGPVSTHAVVMFGADQAWDPAEGQLELGSVLAGVALVPLEPKSRTRTAA